VEFQSREQFRDPGSQDSMTDISNDETRLRATETQMRRALGLQPAPRLPGAAAPTVVPGGSHRPTRRFVRDGEVVVSAAQHDAAGGTNQLEAARQAAQSQTAAREQAERRLAEAQETIRDLQTQLAHERLARDEAVQRAVGEREAAEQVLASLQEELLTVRAALQQTEQRLKVLLAKPTMEDPRARRAGTTQRTMAGALPEGAAKTEAPQPPAPARRRGRPRKLVQPESQSDFVEWWKPDWKERLR
jgi:hypothetical protein